MKPRHNLNMQAKLSPRQREAVTRLALGWSIKEIGADLGLVPGTIAAHLEQAKRKIGGRKAADLTRFAIEQGWLGRHRGEPGARAAPTPAQPLLREDAP